jgi:hypothetical protein
MLGLAIDERRPAIDDGIRISRPSSFVLILQIAKGKIEGKLALVCDDEASAFYEIEPDFALCFGQDMAGAPLSCS